MPFTPVLPVGLVFRQLNKKDATAMCGLEHLCFSLPWSIEQCQGALAQSHFVAFGLFKDKEMLAYISFFHCEKEIEIVNLAVHPQNRRLGYGFNILTLLLQAAAKMGIQKAVLEVRESNTGALALYEKTGFHRTGIRPRYYPDNGENALIYCCDIKPETPPSAVKEKPCKK